MPVEQMIVAAVKMADRARQHAQRRQIEIDQLPEARPHQRADEDHVAAAPRAAPDRRKPAKLRDMRPVMRVVLDALRIGPAAQRRTAPRRVRRLVRSDIGNRERKGAAATDNGDRARPAAKSVLVMTR